MNAQVKITRAPGPPLITRDPEIQGGEPCIAGSRVIVAAILGYWLGGEGVASIYEDFPHVPYGSIELAEEWARTHGIPESVPYRRMPFAKAG